MPAPVIEIDQDAFATLGADEQREELARLARVKRVMESNPLWAYVPHLGELGWKREQGLAVTGEEYRGQVEFHEIDRPIGAFVAGNRSGKSVGGVVDNLIQTLPLGLLPPWLQRFKRWGLDGEPYYCRVVGVDLPQWLAKVMLPTIRRWVPEAALWKGSFDKAYNDRTRKLQFADGGWWDFLTHDMPVDAYAGASLHRVHFDEEPEGELGKQQYEECLARLVDFDGEVRWTLTPLLGLSFAYYELTDRNGAPRDDDEVKVVRGDIDHNPHLSQKGRAAYLGRMRKRDPLRLQARKSGAWVHFAGLIYEEFHMARHRVPDREIPRGENGDPVVEIYAAIDPGIAKDHPAALVFAWLDRDDVLEIFHTHRIVGGTVADMAAYFHQYCEDNEFRPRWTVIDPAAKNRNPQTGRNTQQVFIEHGVHTFAGQNPRVPGFNRVKERLRDDPPRLLVHASCEEFFDEIVRYRWKQPRGRQEDSPNPEPIKRDDDVMDAVRYLVMSMPVKPGPQERPDEDLSEGERAFRHSLKRLDRRGRRVRIGGAVPA